MFEFDHNLCLAGADLHDGVEVGNDVGVFYVSNPLEFVVGPVDEYLLEGIIEFPWGVAVGIGGSQGAGLIFMDELIL